MQKCGCHDLYLEKGNNSGGERLSGQLINLENKCNSLKKGYNNHKTVNLVSVLL